MTNKHINMYIVVALIDAHNHCRNDVECLNYVAVLLLSAVLVLLLVLVSALFLLSATDKAAN